MSDHHLVVGVGITGRAVARALVHRGEAVTAVDDRPGPEARAAMAELGVELIEAPDEPTLGRLVAAADAVVPAPGVPARHPVFRLARDRGRPVVSEFDLAARWDDRPWLAVTGTDGKTTVTTLVCRMLEASGRRARAVGNTPEPLVAAIADPSLDVFVVEASSFRLEHSQRFVAEVAAWLNFAPDHLDSHTDVDAYEAAKARIWRDQGPEQVAVGNADDPVVAGHLARAPGRRIRFSLHGEAEYRLVDAAPGRSDAGRLVGPEGELSRVADLPRRFPHDLANALAAAATALAGGASPEGVGRALAEFRGLPHRVALVGEADGVRYVDDSKATTPHAAVAAVVGFASVVLICGGRNKGLDLRQLAGVADHIRSVVAIGEAAPEVEAAFAGVRPTTTASTMDDAVAAAAAAARPGDVVLLAPGCASYDWYRSYGERGDDFARAAREVAGAR